MNFRVTRTKNNAVAGILANMGLQCTHYTLWDSSPLEINTLLSRDANRFLNYRICQYISCFHTYIISGFYFILALCK